MGNCMRRGTSSNDDDRGSSYLRRQGSKVMDESGGGGGGGEEAQEKEMLLGGSASVSSLSTSMYTREVKIKITKKELEELIGRADVQGLSVEQVLARLINGGDFHRSDDQLHQRSWRPVLQSIPEVN